MGKMFIYLSGHTSSPKINRTKNQTKEIENEIDIFYNISWDKNFASYNEIFAGFVDFVDSPSCSKVSSHLYFCFFVFFCTKLGTGDIGFHSNWCKRSHVNR